MKKKTVIAILAMCMALTATACGKEADKEVKTQETAESKEDVKAETKTTEAVKEDSSDAEKDTEKDSENQKSTDSVRLIDVKDLSDYVSVGEYKGLKLNRITQTVTDDDIQAEIDYELQDKGNEVKDGATEGDVVTINYTGTIDGKEFDGGSAEDYELTIGEGTMIDGFEDGIVGMKPGETKELDLTFPEDYDEELGGKAAVFKVTLQKDVRKADLTDEWVTTNTDYKNVDEYRAGVKKDLEQQASEIADSTLYSDAWSEVVSASEVKKYPEEAVNKAIDEYKAQYDAYVKEVGIEMSDFLEAQGMTEEDYEKECKDYAQNRVEQNMLVQYIMDKEGLSVDDKDAGDLEKELCQEYGVTSLDEIADIYGQSEVDEAKALLRVEKFIVANATVEEKTGSEDDLIANEDAYGDDSGEDSEGDNGDVEYEIIDESEE